MYLRRVAAAFLTLALAGPANAASLDGGVPNNSVFQWIQAYRVKPRPATIPQAVKDMAKLGAFRDPDSAGFYVGFVAGALATNPKQAPKLAAKMLPLPPEDEWAIVRAVAWSGLPDWKELLSGLRPKLPTRQVMIDKYLGGQLPTLTEITVVPDAPRRGWKAVFHKKRKGEDKPLPTGDSLDALWGYYLATGSPEPIDRMIAVLPLSKDTDDTARLTLGGMAKYMLASAAVRDVRLLALLKEAQPRQDEATQKILGEVIDAAESVDAGRIRAEQVAAIEELRTKGPGSRRKVAWWGKLSEGAISLGCVVAAATGQFYLGVPCVVGGAATSAALRYWASQK
jgi:hypothetical protein